MATKTIEHKLTLEVIECTNCGTPFGIQEHLLDSLRHSGRSFYCPNGHTLSYSGIPTKAEREIERLKSLLQDEQSANRYLENSLQCAKDSLRATKAAHTRTKKRIAAGVCPCCNRQFVNLHRHMANQHPEYTKEGEAQA